MHPPARTPPIERCPVPELTERAIRELRRDGRASFSDIARRLGTSRAQVTGRLTPLLESGQLKILAVAHPRLLGLDYVSHLLVKTVGNSAPVIRQLEGIPALVFTAEIAGEYQLSVELHNRSLEELQQSLRELRAIPGVREVLVHLYEQQLHTFFLGEELGRTLPALDSTDLTLLGYLQRDGRASFRELSDASGLSVSGCRLRVNRMLEGGVMQIGVVRHLISGLNQFAFGFGFTLSGSDEKLVETIRAEAGLEFLVRTVGRFDFIATIVFTATENMKQFLDRAWSAPHVERVEAWMHVSVPLERFHQSTQRVAQLQRE